MIWHVQMYHQHSADNIMVYVPKGIYLTNFVRGKPKNALASEDPNYQCGKWLDNEQT